MTIIVAKNKTKKKCFYLERNLIIDKTKKKKQKQKQKKNKKKEKKKLLRRGKITFFFLLTICGYRI